MTFEIGWSDLLIEKGARDPLALWRVGDRMVADLLGPFTTVVDNRPARYLSMYCWVIYFLNGSQNIKDKRTYWKRFYELEAFLLCAIQLHKEHNYDHFTGQIGSEMALQLIGKAKDGKINLAMFDKISNGWESNYKGPMEQFKLTELDYGIPSGLNLTILGQKLAQAYMNSIKGTRFYQSYKSKSEVPLDIIKELAPRSCTCLLHSPQTDFLRKERETCVICLLKPSLFVPENKTEEKDLWLSIFLFLDFLRALNECNERMDLQAWRRVLSTRLFADGKSYSPKKDYLDVFKKWQVYNIDSLLVFALESGLSGFLEMLHKKDGAIYKPELTATSFHESFKAIKQDIQNSNVASFEDSVKSTIQNFERLPTAEQLRLEIFLVNAVTEKNDEQKIICFFLLYIYAQAVFNRLRSNADYKDALSFYEYRSHLDGYEMSLFHTSSDIGSCADGIEGLFYEYFLSELIVNRQLTTRRDRGKEQAWFSYINETKTYEWESDYKPTLYRAARSDILMTFLLSLEIVSLSKGEGWSPNMKIIQEMRL